MRSKRLNRAALAAALLGLACAGAARAEAIKIGVVRSMGASPHIVAKDKGFFAAEGLDAQLVFFESAQPIALAVASGDVDFGSTGVTAAFFNLAAQGGLKIIGAGIWDTPGFHSVGFLESNQAYAAGLRGYADIGNHSVGITQLGSPLQYFFVLLGEKYHIDPKGTHFLALQSNGNVASALAGGQVDLAVQTTAGISAIVQRGDARLLGWLSDVLGRRQGEAVFTATRTTDERPDTIRHFMNALRKGEGYVHDAFADANDQRRNGPTASEVLAICARALGQSAADLAKDPPFFDPQSRVSMVDIDPIIAWYKAQGMLKSDTSAKALVDLRYAIEMPTR